MDSAYMRLQIEIVFLMIFHADVAKIIYSSSKHQGQLRPHLYHHAVQLILPVPIRAIMAIKSGRVVVDSHSIHTPIQILESYWPLG